MKLYKGGFGQYQYYTVANNEGSAIKQIQDKNSMGHLPVTAEEINEVDGYKIVPVKDGEVHEDNGQGEGPVQRKAGKKSENH